MTRLLLETWALMPDMRLGQLVDNARAISGFAGDTFNVEDDVLEQGLREMKAAPAQRRVAMNRLPREQAVASGRARPKARTKTRAPRAGKTK